MLYILYILHLQSFTYTYSFILYVDIAVLHVDLHKSICMYVNMNYALVYTNLNPICFVLHFIHVYIYIHIVYYISMLSKHACALHTHTHTHTRVHVRWCLKQNFYSSPSSWSLLTSAFFSTFFCAPSRSSPRCLSPTTRSRRSAWKCWSLNTCRSGKNHYIDDSFHRGLT